MTISEMCIKARATAVAKGFSECENIDQKILLAVGELVEAQNELRDGHVANEIYYEDSYPYSAPSLELHRNKPEGFGIELADAVIRIGQLALSLDVDLEHCVLLKMAYNDTRPHMHGKAF